MFNLLDDEQGSFGVRWVYGYPPNPPGDPGPGVQIDRGGTRELFFFHLGALCPKFLFFLAFFCPKSATLAFSAKIPGQFFFCLVLHVGSRIGLPDCATVQKGASPPLLDRRGGGTPPTCPYIKPWWRIPFSESHEYKLSFKLSFKIVFLSGSWFSHNLTVRSPSRS